MKSHPISKKVLDRIITLAGWWYEDDHNGPYQMWDDTTWIFAINRLRKAKTYEEVVSILTRQNDFCSPQELHHLLQSLDSFGDGYQ